MNARYRLWPRLLIALFVVSVIATLMVRQTPTDDAKHVGTEGMAIVVPRMVRLPITQATTTAPVVPAPTTTTSRRTSPSAVRPPESTSDGYNRARASWYHLPGNNYADGSPYDGSLVVAHRTLAFGTRVEVCFNACTTATVRDRGPFIKGRDFDLNKATADAVGLTGVQTIRWRIV